jgi:hypothetical protein
MSVYQKIDDKIKDLQNIRNYIVHTTAIVNKIVELEVIDARIEELNWVLENL